MVKNKKQDTNNFKYFIKQYKYIFKFIIIKKFGECFLQKDNFKKEFFLIYSSNYVFCNAYFFFFDFFDLEDFLCHLHNEILDSEQ